MVAGTSPSRDQRFCTGEPSTKSHRKATGSSSSSQARALPTAAVTLARLRTMPGSAEAALDVVGAEGGHGRRVEPGEAAGVAVALVQDRRPRQPGLGALEDDELEQPPRVALGHAPLGVVVVDVVRIAGLPAAARPAVGHAGL